MANLFSRRKAAKHTKDHPSEALTSTGKAKESKISKAKDETLADILKDDAIKSREHFHMRNLCWFHGNINRKFAETKLRQGIYNIYVPLCVFNFVMFFKV